MWLLSASIKDHSSVCACLFPLRCYGQQTFFCVPATYYNCKTINCYTLWYCCTRSLHMRQQVHQSGCTKAFHVCFLIKIMHYNLPLNFRNIVEIMVLCVLKRYDSLTVGCRAVMVTGYSVLWEGLFIRVSKLIQNMTNNAKKNQHFVDFTLFREYEQR